MHISLPVQDKVGLFSVLEDLSAPVEGIHTQSMERLGQNYGYILYRSNLDTEDHIGRLRLYREFTVCYPADVRGELHLRDLPVLGNHVPITARAQVFVDSTPLVTLYDRELLEEKQVDASFEKGASLDILVSGTSRYLAITSR